MGSTATLTYSVSPTGQSETNTQTAMAAAAVPVPPDLLLALGVRVTSDATTAANPCVRTIAISLIPSSTATATCVVQSEKIAGVTVTGAGADYIQPPQVVFVSTTPVVSPGHFAGNGRWYTPVLTGIVRKAQAQAFLELVNTANLIGGSGFSATPNIAFVGGFPPANAGGPGPFNVMAVNIAPKKIGGIVSRGGANYSVNTQIQFRGNAIGGLQATAVPTIVNGKITAVTVTNPGLYSNIPQAYAWDPGTGVVPNQNTEFVGLDSCQLATVVGQGTPALANATVVMGAITAINITNNGDGYIAPPTPVITDVTGVNASFTVSMGVGRISIIDGGQGYADTPTVTLTPYFKSLWPDNPTGNQAKPFFDFMTRQIQIATASQVVAGIPAIT